MTDFQQNKIEKYERSLKEIGDLLDYWISREYGNDCSWDSIKDKNFTERSTPPEKMQSPVERSAWAARGEIKLMLNSEASHQ